MDESVAQNRREELQRWLGRFLLRCDDAELVGGEVVEAIITTLETCLPISERTLSHPLPDPSELAGNLESR